MEGARRGREETDAGALSCPIHWEALLKVWGDSTARSPGIKEEGQEFGFERVKVALCTG
jgi:hypothetical protein